MLRAPAVDTRTDAASVGVGWRVGQFALDCFRPEDGIAAGNSAVWDCYRRWCAGRKEVPLAFAVFNNELEKVADAAGIPVRQTGAHVHYIGVTLVEGAR